MRESKTKLTVVAAIPADNKVPAAVHGLAQTHTRLRRSRGASEARENNFSVTKTEQRSEQRYRKSVQTQLSGKVLVATGPSHLQREPL